RQRQRIPAGQAAALYKLGARQHLFKNTTLMAVILEVLSRWRDEGDLCVAVPVAPPPGGPLTNRSSFIALTWQPAEGTLLERAHILQQDVMEGLDRLAFSGVDIARQLVETHGGGPALPVVITNGLAWPVAASESPMQWQGGLTQTPQVAMDIRISQQADGTLVLDIDYASEALEAALVSDLLAAMARAVARLAEGKAFHLPDLVTPTHARHNSLPDAACHTDFLQRIADRLFHPQHEAVALIQGERRFSYRELGHGVGRVMHALSEAGIEAGQVVAICLPRSPEHTMVTLACALSGIIWVPVDAASPADRRRYLLDNCCP
ncbi:AMP-binding protein, partial [Aeromonas dhakensis]